MRLTRIVMAACLALAIAAPATIASANDAHHPSAAKQTKTKKVKPVKELVSSASSKMIMCSGDHLSKMTTMISGMLDGPHKWEMYTNLEMVNTTMAKDGVRGCEKLMMNMHRHHHQHMHDMGHTTHKKTM